MRICDCKAINIVFKFIGVVQQEVPRLRTWKLWEKANCDTLYGPGNSKV